MNKLVKLILPLIILIALVVTLVVVQGQKEAADGVSSEGASEATQMVVDLSKDALKSIVVTQADNSLTYVQAEGRWTIEGYEDANLEQGTISYRCTTLTQMKTSRTLETSDLKEYGLDSPKATITYNLKDGTSFSIFAGNNSPDNKSTYVIKSNEDNRVYLIDKLSSDAFDTTINALRQTKLATYDITTISGLTASGRDFDKLTIDYDQTQEGNLVNYHLNTDKLKDVVVSSKSYSDLLSLLPSMEAKDFVEDNVTDLSKYGLDNPVLHLSLKVTETTDATDAAGNAQTLVSTNEDEYIWGDTLEDGLVAFMPVGDTTVYTMDGSFISDFIAALDPFKLSDKWIALVNISDVSKVEITLGDQKYDVTIDEANKSYKVNDKVLEEKTFKELYISMINLQAETEFKDIALPTGNPAVSLIYTLNDGSIKEANFYSYDKQFYLSTLNESMVVGCSIKQFSGLEEILAQAVQ